MEWGKGAPRCSLETSQTSNRGNIDRTTPLPHGRKLIKFINISNIKQINTYSSYHCFRCYDDDMQFYRCSTTFVPM